MLGSLPYLEPTSYSNFCGALYGEFSSTVENTLLDFSNMAK